MRKEPIFDTKGGIPMKRLYRHIIVIGVDGAGGFFEQAETPAFDRIFAHGAQTYRALASNPTISAECWGSMLIGTSPKVHGLTNGWISEHPYPVDSDFPTVFRRIREADPDAELGAISCWNPINTGIIEDDPKIYKFSAGDDDEVPVIERYIREKKPDFLFVQFDSVDGAGHGCGYGTKGHLDRIGVIDTFLDRIYNTIVDTGIADETLFIVLADHGGRDTGHGGWSDTEKYVTFAAIGKTVKEGHLEKVNVRDLASIILYAYGLEAPAFLIGGWTSQIPAGLFADDAVPAYRDISEEEDAAPRVSRVHHTSETV